MYCGVLQLGKSVKTHLYWAMKNCDGCAETLRKLIEIIPDHYQVLRACTASYDLCHSVDRETIQDATAFPRATSPTTCQGKRSSKTPTLQQRS